MKRLVFDWMPIGIWEAAEAFGVQGCRRHEVMSFPKFYMNLPAMPDVAAVDAAADKLGAHRVAGYRGHDGLRANVEIDKSVAELLDKAALEIELRGCALEAIAEESTQMYLTGFGKRG